MTGLARFRRSPLLLMEWRAGDLVLLHCDSQRRFVVDFRVVRVLSSLDDWRSLEDLEVDGAPVPESAIARLVEIGVVERADGGEPGTGAAPFWAPAELAVHRASNTGGARADGATFPGAPPPIIKRRPPGEVTHLPAPGPLPPEPIGEVLGRRRSRRTYASRSLRLDELSTLLHHSARVVRTLPDGAAGGQALRPFPGGGARSELEIYVVACDVEGLDAGAHYFDPRAHELIRIRERDEHQERLLAWVHATTDGALSREPPAVLLVTAVVGRIMWKYSGIGLGLIYKDTGGLFQTLYLVATAMGLAPCALGGGEELANSRWLGLDPLEETQVGCFVVGPTADAAATMPRPVAPPPQRIEPGPTAPAADGAETARRAPGWAATDRVLRTAQGFLPSGVLRAAVELGVFDALAGGPVDAGAVAEALGASPRGMRILLDALAALRLLDRAGAAHRLTAAAAAVLVRSSPDFAGGTFSAYAHDLQWRGMGRLADAVRDGGSALSDVHEAGTSDYWERMAEGLGTFVDAPAAALEELVRPWAEQRERLHVLDVGCGTGAAGFAIATRHPRAHVWSVDLPAVLRVAAAHADRVGVAGSVSYVAGDVFEVTLPGPCDLAIVSHVLHHFAPERCVELLRRVAGALAPDGRVVIQEFVTGIAPPSADPDPYLFSALVLSVTRGGEAHTLEAYNEMLAAAEFGAATVHGAGGMPSRFLVADVRPA